MIIPCFIPIKNCCKGTFFFHIKSFLILKINNFGKNIYLKSESME